MKHRFLRAGALLLLTAALLLSALPMAAAAETEETPEKTVIACCGDSLTVSYLSTNGKSYPRQLQTLLGDDYTVRAFGVNGSTASTTGNFNGSPSGYALQSAYQQSLALQPDVVLLTLGSNDAKVINWQNGAGAAQYEEDYRALIAAYQTLDSHPLVILGISPSVQVEGTDHNAILNRYVLEVNEIQRKVAAELGLPTVDIHALLEGRDDLFDEDAEHSGGDGCHPNNLGYGEIAAAFAKAIRIYAAREDDASLVEFSLAGESGGVDTAAGTIYVTVPYAAELETAPQILLPDGAAVSPAADEVQDFSQPVTYTVTARDGVTTQTYTVYTTRGPRVKVACVGDSITRGGFPINLQKLLGDSYEVKNFGENSTTVCTNGLKETGDGRGAYIYHNVYKQSLEYQPNVVFILLGANDSKEAGGNPDWVTNWTEGNKASFKEDLTALVTAYRALDSQPLVVIASPTKGYSGAWGVSASNIEKEIIPLEREVAEETGCPFLDLFALFDGHPEWLGDDQLHPNEAGNEQIAAAYEQLLLPLKLTVSAVPVELSVVTPPLYNDVIQGETPDLPYATVGLTYSNGTMTQVPLTADMLGKIDYDTLGEQTVSVTWQGFSTEVTIVVRGKGDVNGNGVVDTTDARLTLQYAARRIPAEQLDLTLADVNGDGAVDTTDARLILQYAARRISRLY